MRDAPQLNAGPWELSLSELCVSLQTKCKEQQLKALQDSLCQSKHNRLNWLCVNIEI